MKVLILGVSGLIGHKLLQVLSKSFDTYGTLHHSKQHYKNHTFFNNHKIIENVDVRDFCILEGIMKTVNPDVILNCVGITKRKEEVNNLVQVLEVNSIFPHKLAHWAKKYKKRVIHFSTDCVFNGNEGNYNEESLTNANDSYGRTKAFGEIVYNHTLTIRSSFIGFELFGKTELLEWFLSQKGKQIKGFKKTYYSGVSTIFMAKTVKSIIENHPQLHGLYQLAPKNPISKYDLLCLAKESFGIKIDIIPDEKHIHAPTLDSGKIRNKMNIVIPSWSDMMNQLASEKEFYTNT